MWRGICNVPRAFRSHWNCKGAKSPSQTVCCDDDNAAASVISRNEAVCTSHYSTLVFIQRQKCHEKYSKYKKRKSNGEKTTDCGWDEWLRSFRRDFRSRTGSPCMLEAVGWSAVLVLGLHVSQYFKLWNTNYLRRYNQLTEQAWLEYHARQLAHVFYIQKIDGLMSSMLPAQYGIVCHKFATTTVNSPEDTPPCDRRPKERDKYICDPCQIHTFEDFEPGTIELQNDAEEDHLSQIILQYDSTLSHQDSTVLNEESGTKDELGDARSSWSDLSQHYVNIGCNVAAYQYTERGDIEEAMALWKRSNALGSSCFNLGLCYELGRGVDVDLVKASVYYEAAAAHGHSKAMYNLALLYLQAAGVPVNRERAIKLLKQAARCGLDRAQCDLGALYAKDDEQTNEASAMFELSAKQKDKIAQYNLGLCYQHGCGVPQNLCKAAELYGQSARQGHGPAQYMLATFFQYELGGLPQDSKIADDWYRKAAEQGISEPPDCPDHLQDLPDQCSGSFESSTKDASLALDTVKSHDDVLRGQSETDTDASDHDPIGESDTDETLGITTKNTQHNNTSYLDNLLIGTGEGHFGESIPKISFSGSFGNISLGKSVPRSKWKKQSRSVVDLRGINTGEAFLSLSCDDTDGFFGVRDSVLETRCRVARQ